MGMVMTSCTDGAVGDDFADDNYKPKGIIIKPGGVGGCLEQGLGSSSISIDLDSNGEDGVADVYVQYAGGEKALAMSDVAMPGTYSSDFSTILDLTSVEIGNVMPGDIITMSYIGKSSSGEYVSSHISQTGVICNSDLAGMHTFETTGIVKMEEDDMGNPTTIECDTIIKGDVGFTYNGCGGYSTSDFSFGVDGVNCWTLPAVEGSFNEDCGSVSASVDVKVDMEEFNYQWQIKGVSGDSLMIELTTSGNHSANVLVLREGGADWPENLDPNN